MHPALREDAERRLRIHLALGAIARRDGLEPSAELVAGVMGDIALSCELSREEVLEALKADKALAARMATLVLHLCAAQHVMGKAKVRYG